MFCQNKKIFSRLKGSLISQEEYEAVKKLYLAMKIENLGELNMLYNLQDAIISCKIFEF